MAHTKKTHSVVLFNQKQVRRFYDEEKETWYFSVIDVIEVLTESKNPQVYWRVLKKRLLDEGSNETVTKCNGLKMVAPDGKMRLADVADTETLLRLIHFFGTPTTKDLVVGVPKKYQKKSTGNRKPPCGGFLGGRSH